MDVEARLDLLSKQVVVKKGSKASKAGAVLLKPQWLWAWTRSWQPTGKGPDILCRRGRRWRTRVDKTR